MYCNKCGKYIAGNDILCDDCKKNIQVEEKIEKSIEPSSKPTKINVKLVVSCFVASLIAFVVVLVAFGFLFPIMLSVAKNGYKQEEITYLIIYLVATSILMAVSIFILVLGIKAIRSFVRAKRNKEKPRALILVFGIISVSISAFVALYALVLMMFPILMLVTRIIPTVYVNGVPV